MTATLFLSNIFCSCVKDDKVVSQIQLNGINYITNPDDASSVSVTASTDPEHPYSGNVVIPSTITSGGATYNVTNISNDAFTGCTGVTSVTIPNSVKVIGSNAFSGCTSLATVTIGSGVKSIGSGAFSGCTALVKVTLNSEAIVAKQHAPTDNIVTIFGTQVKEYILGEDAPLSYIPQYSFSGGLSLSVVTIGKMVGFVMPNAFANCPNLTKFILNSNWVGERSNDNTDNIGYVLGEQLKELVIGDNVSEIGNWAFCNCPNLESVTIGDGVKSIGEGAFHSSNKLAELTIGNNVETISYMAFQNCHSLSFVEIPNSVTNIGTMAFRRCYYLSALIIGSGVTFIGDYAFEDCYSLLEVACLGEKVPSTNTRIFFNLSLQERILYVPEAAINTYLTTEPWSDFGTIYLIASSGDEAQLRNKFMAIK